MSADDQFEPAPEQGFPSNPDFPSNVDTSSAYSGNRPASGARRATPGEVLSQGFQGAENAGDFLGLDVEFAGAQGGLDLVPPPGTYVQPEGDPSAPEPAPMPEGDAAQEFAQAPSAFEFGEDLGSEESAAGEESFAVAGTGGGSKAPLFVGGLLLAGLAGAGYFFGPGLYTQYFGKSEIEIAKGPAAGSEKPEMPSKAPGAKNEPKGGEIAALPANGSGEPSAKTPSDPSEPATKQPNASDARPPRTNGGHETSTPAVSAAKPELEVPAPSATQDDAVVVSSTTPRTASAFPDISGAEYDWAAASPLEMIWRGSEVPLEAVRAPARTLMPKVGQVRVFTTTGDVFDGRLYAVGQNRVWVDAAPGRIGLDGDLVERIEVLPPDAGNTADGAPIAGGKQVRARVAGGVLYGRILKSSGESVTLALEDGGRVIVQASDIEDLGSGRTIVVRR